MSFGYFFQWKFTDKNSKLFHEAISGLYKKIVKYTFECIQQLKNFDEATHFQ